MRISTNMMQQLGINSILQQQSDLSKTQNQLATGKQVLVASDNPVAASQMLSLQHTIDTTNQYQSNITSATNRLNFEEGVLQNTTNILQQVRTLAIAGNNATQTNQTRGYIASQIRQQLAQILSQANSTDDTGSYVFSGSKGNVQPFSVNGSGAYVYNGDQMQRFIQTGPSTQVADSDPGSSVFQMIRNGNGTFSVQPSSSNTGSAVVTTTSLVGNYTPSLPNGYTINFIQALPTDPITYQVTDSSGNPLKDTSGTVIPPQTYTSGQTISFAGAQLTVTGTPANGDTVAVKSSQNQDLFTTVNQLASALETQVYSPTQQAQLNNSVNAALTNLDQAMSSINTVEASVGTRLNAISSQQSINSDQVLHTTSVLSSIQDLDYASAVSKLNMQTTGLQAALQAYLRVQGLSLFSLLK